MGPTGNDQVVNAGEVIELCELDRSAVAVWPPAGSAERRSGADRRSGRDRRTVDICLERCAVVVPTPRLNGTASSLIEVGFAERAIEMTLADDARATSRT